MPTNENRISITEVAPPSSIRKKGCFRVAAVLIQDKQNKGQSQSIEQSWLPISGCASEELSLALEDKIVPVLLDESVVINRMLPVLRNDLLSQGRDQVLLPVSFFYRPKILDTPLFDGHDTEDITVLTSVPFYNKVTVEDRVLLTLAGSTNDPTGYKKLLEIVFSVLDGKDIDPVYYGIETSKPTKELVQDILTKFPNLVNHVFKALPNLHVLRYKALVCDNETTVTFIRYKPEYFKGIISKKYFMENLSHITT